MAANHFNPLNGGLNGLSFGMQEDATYESDVEAEIEVDQLDSDSDMEVDNGKPGATTKNGARPGVRVPGHTLLPAVRMENIIQADGTTGSMSISKEGLFLLSIATEEFIKRLVQAGHREASAHRRNQINYTDMAATTHQYQEFMILADTIPTPVSLSEALYMRQAKEKALLEDNPALAGFDGGSLVPSPEPEPTFAVLKGGKKGRTNGYMGANGNGKENGKDRANGSSSSSKRPPKKSNKPHEQLMHHSMAQSMPPHGDWPDHYAANGHLDPHHRRTSRGVLPMNSAASSLPPPPNGLGEGLNEIHSPPYVPESGYEIDTMHSPPQDDPESQPPSPRPYSTAPMPWAGRFTGPASGFLSASPYGRPPPQNPGRTIYSQSNNPA